VKNQIFTCQGPPSSVRQFVRRLAPELMEGLVDGRMRGTGAPRKYRDEIRERATWMAAEARRDPATRARALARVGKQLGINPETLRNWVNQAGPTMANGPAPPLLRGRGSRAWSGRTGSCAGLTRS
jgi:transposase-like protein